MKLFIKSVLQFIPFSIAVYLILVCFWGSFVPPAFYKNLHTKSLSKEFTENRLFEAKQTANVDILFLGNSRSYRGFDPRIFETNGFSTFNLGTSNQSLLQTELLVKRYVSRIKPVIVIFAVSPAQFMSDGIESSLDLVANERPGVDLIQLAVQQNQISIYNSLIFGMFNNSVSNPTGDFKRLKGNQYVSGGYVHLKLKNQESKSVEKISFQFNSTQLNAFKKTVELLKKQNIRLILVQTPASDVYNKSISGQKSFDDEMKKCGEYINFNRKIELSDDLHFYDSQHLNQQGVRLFNRKLIEILLSGKIEG